MEQLSAQVTQLLNKPFTQPWQRKTYAGLLAIAWVQLVTMFHGSESLPAWQMLLGSVIGMYLGIKTLRFIEEVHEAFMRREPGHTPHPDEI